VVFVKPLKVKVSVTLDEDIVDKIKALSENDDRSFSQYVNHILKKHIEKEQKSEDNLHV
jgi:metal-responsive CopG/Arc/MetJ family transcriptional regulator